MSNTNTTNKTPGKALTAQQQRAIRAMLTARTVEDAAKAAGVSRATMFRWLADASFCDELRRAERDALATVTRRLTALAVDAAQVLDDTMSDPDAKRADKLRAADIALGKMLDLRKLYDLEERVAALEAAQDGTR